MFSGKSTELIRRIRLLQTINKKVLIAKPAIDSRYIKNSITSHNYESVECLVLNRLDDISNETIQEYDTIIVDEGQFFPDLKLTVTHWIRNYSVSVIIGGLDGDFQRNPIGEILDLIPYADKCQKLNSLCCLCKDGTEAPFTKRLVASTDTVLVGGAECYTAVCRKHYDN
jgi:thymidine kinase